MPATLNGRVSVEFTLDSGASYVQIPEQVVHELERLGALLPTDRIRQQNFALADGSKLQLPMVRLRQITIGGRTMANVMVAIGGLQSRTLLGQSFLRRLDWWKIDNITNTAEFEFTRSP